MRVINLFGGPGVGKSTAAAELFVAMKKAGLSVELVTEYAKDLTWENRVDVLGDQPYIFTKQHRRLSRLDGKVDWVVTDSPLLFSLIYAPLGTTEKFKDFVFDQWYAFDNCSFFLPRHPDYVYKMEGRHQSKKQALAIDKAIYSILPEDAVELAEGSNFVEGIITALGLPITLEVRALRLKLQEAELKLRDVYEVIVRSERKSA